MRRHSGKSFALGAIFGGLVGGMTALLFAPKSGEKLRKDVINKYQDVSKQTSQVIDSLCEQSTDLVKRAKTIAEDVKDMASDLLKDRK